MGKGIEKEPTLTEISCQGEGKLKEGENKKTRQRKEAARENTEGEEKWSRCLLKSAVRAQAMKSVTSYHCRKHRLSKCNPTLNSLATQNPEP